MVDVLLAISIRGVRHHTLVLLVLCPPPQREMDRRDIRDALLLVRAQWVGQLLAHAAATVASEPSSPSSFSPPGARRRETLQAAAAPNAASPASASSIVVPVERRLAELPCAEVFDLCMEFV